MKFDPKTLAVSKLSYSSEKWILKRVSDYFFIDNMPFNINLDICQIPEIWKNKLKELKERLIV